MTLQAKDGDLQQKELKKGFPDILVLKDGKCIGLEVKTNVGKQSKEQKEMEKLMKEHGADYYVVRSLDEVIEIVGGKSRVLKIWKLLYLV